ncbi:MULTISPECIES: sulfotransferase family protein [Sphingomonadales]|uniref:Sulfotransferase n=2 Tax=Edaphosphingomonas TaxID=3423724 RepID=A0A2T4HMX8_9SPHN|nr:MULTISPECIES: sulfotransferase [Sphingomonas]AGH51337.1 hypothetical protein G432_18095 [Sphingomonas sp. MM-1]MDX3883995.1 sulfotransferase [Sphingomonas sp.]OHT19869.1 hypothetical protein BHE75_01861 [Sphingomonas haloaromaticamans]PTD17127.1 sulfotransferase [Sphingomonas fennica]
MTAKVPDREALIAEAKAKTGLDDFGDTWFFSHIDALIPAFNGEAKLSDAGAAYARETVVTSLVNRLRFVEMFKQHPEIDEEEVEVAAVVVGLPRTGSTMLHRMLAAAPGMTGCRWYETKNYVPFPGEERGNPEPRRAEAKVLMDYMVQAIPELMSIHPMDIDQPDEELIIMGQLFSSTMIEGTFFVPSFARWLMQHDRIQVYRDLKQILKLLQWSDPSRKGAKWVLKTPGHLMGIDGVIEVFPEAKIVMTHRDPVQTVPSYSSMMANLYSMVSDEVTREEVGAFWIDRLAELLNTFVAEREKVGGRNFIDVRYTEQLSEPVKVGRYVLEQAGITVTPEIEAGMAEWIEANKREDRAPHKYSLEDFGLTRAQVEEKFRSYREAFLEKTPA